MTSYPEPDPHPDDHPDGPFAELSRQAWSELATADGYQLSQETLDQLRGLEDPTSLDDVREVYLPLTKLICLHQQHATSLYRETNRFFRLKDQQTPFVIAVTGSVAVGKSTVSRLLRNLLTQSEGHPKVTLVTTDGFLMSNAELARRGLTERKGFPESYRRRELLDFIVKVKSGEPEVKCPVYDHVIYDIVPGKEITVQSPDILIVEGLNVLQPSRRHSDGATALSAADFVDFSVYVDANVSDIRRWYIERVLKLRELSFNDPTSFFTQWADKSDAELTKIAGEVWDSCNGVNLMFNIRPTRSRATVILRKGPDHKIERVRIRKI